MLNLKENISVCSLVIMKYVAKVLEIVTFVMKKSWNFVLEKFQKFRGPMANGSFEPCNVN